MTACGMKIENTGIRNLSASPLHLYNSFNSRRFDAPICVGKGFLVSIEGFERWQKIYGETDDVNPVQKAPCRKHGQPVLQLVK